MQITKQDTLDGDRILTLRIDDSVLDAELLTLIHCALEGADGGEDINTNIVFLFDCRREDSVVGEFPAWRPGSTRESMRYFACWEDLITNVSRLKAKTFAGYRGRAGRAAVELGLAVDLRLSEAEARFLVGGLAKGRLPGMSSYWLPKFVGLGNARRLLLLGGELDAREAARIGLLDVVDKDLEAILPGTIDKLRSVTPEATYFVRRILDESYWHERMSALEQIKAARYKLGSTERPVPASDTLSALSTIGACAMEANPK